MDQVCLGSAVQLALQHVTFKVQAASYVTDLLLGTGGIQLINQRIMAVVLDEAIVVLLFCARVDGEKGPSPHCESSHSQAKPLRD